MNILTVGYYDDFARFFLAIKKELKENNTSVKFKYLSLYLSGYLYFLGKFEKASFLSLKVRINSIINRKKYYAIMSKDDTYKNIDLTKVIQYHERLGNVDKDSLKLQAISYIDMIEKELLEYKPDILILSGDSRMSIEIFNIKAKELNIKIYYFEQGPFGTTIFDSKGVNANASIRYEVYQNNEQLAIEAKTRDFFKRKRSSKYKRNPFYRGSDYIFQFFFKNTGLLPIDIQMEKENKFLPKEYKNITDRLLEDKMIFLLILQVPYDVNMVYHSPFYNNHFDIVKDIYNELPYNSQLLVREHPLYKGKYEKELYQFMLKNHIALDKKDLYQSIDNANVVIVNNSTVGIEAISRFKPVVVLGNSYYDNDNLCIKLKDKKELANLLINAINFKVNKVSIFNFLNNFLNNYLIDGHFKDNELLAPKTIVKRILNDT